MQNQHTIWAREIGEAALAGTWAKIARSTYKRATGEIVAKNGNVWRIQGGAAYATRAAAFSAVDWSHK
jgi:hypothetical protein